MLHGFGTMLNLVSTGILLIIAFGIIGLIFRILCYVFMIATGITNSIFKMVRGIGSLFCGKKKDTRSDRAALRRSA